MIIKTQKMSEKARSAEEIQIYFLLNKVRYTKEDVDLDEVMGEIIHIMKNRKKIKNKSIFEAKEILNQNKGESNN